MLALSQPTIAHWKKILRNNFTSWEKLAEFLQLDIASGPTRKKRGGTDQAQATV